VFAIRPCQVNLVKNKMGASAMTAHDWLSAIYDDELEGMYLWILDRELRVVEITDSLAQAMGQVKDDLIGRKIGDLASLVQTLDYPLEAREKRLRRILQTNQPETYMAFALLPSLQTTEAANSGWTRLIITTTRITNTKSGQHYLLSSVHDITGIDDSLLFLRAPAFQGLMVLITDREERCLAATEAAARLCGFPDDRQMLGAHIKDTPYAPLHMREREQQRVARSRELGRPMFDMEWLMDNDGRVGAYAIARIGFPGGRKMVMLQPIDPRLAFFQGPPQDMLKAPNVGAPARLTPRKLEVLVDMARHLSPDESSKHLYITEDAVKKHRTELAHIMGVDNARQVLKALRGSELGMLVSAYAQLVDLDAPPGT
jgi:DNA-binding CsgD family transcriptional regulator